ncbi:MAG: hypothetical protein HY574_12555 [candidate division NC10 bacterium]|nr:hypothetical protein [candidate division NC10 bacterium]
MQHLAVGSIVLLLMTGCAMPLTPRESGTLTGAGIGAATGAILGGIAGSAGKGAAIGAAVGAVTGALAGNAIQNEQAARAYSHGSAYPPPGYPYDSRHGRPAPPPNAALQIDVTPDETEIAVDGRRIGQAKEFRGPVVVPVAAGQHLVEFHLRGFSVATSVMVPPQTTVPIRRDLAPTASASPQITPSGVPGRSSH